jgi:ribosomal-protein-alanine N-acetyltransferase
LITAFLREIKHFMTDSGLSLRLAHLAEAYAIANLSRRLIEDGLRWRWTPIRVAASIRAANANVLVACAHGEVIGFAIMRYGKTDAHLDLLAVDPRHRRAGVARQLVEWLEKCAIVAGIFRVELEVRAQNREAQLFYQRMGYNTITEISGYYDGVEAALRMGRNLSRRIVESHLQQVEYSLPGFGVLRVSIP